MPAKGKLKKIKQEADPGRLMQRDQFAGVFEKIEQLAQTRNQSYVSQDEAIERLVPQINTALANGHRLEDVFELLEAEGVPLTRLLRRSIRGRLNVPQPRRRNRRAPHALAAADANVA